MDELRGYKIPLVGIPDGMSKHEYEPDKEFFEYYKNDQISSGDFKVKLTMDKQENMFILNFDINGFSPTECDRCMANINLPVSSNYGLIVQLDDQENDDPDVAHIPTDSIHLNIADYLYDFLVMSIPMVKIYDCENEDPRPCDLNALEKLESNNINTGDSGIWDELKNLEVKK